ncbi:hypothetical protein GS597_08950 [Synechococcales cyanobacterium C]|uniref:Type I restriction enzyme R protein N-terminal domain-containing protein n=1 Tax=Petrachloros mirabilis ULC683 TaxID=2781853 RepID=A0A8K1ZWU7_9CYAN|nr:hypothetical protein [Petrachloros mirabilis ULC683]
MAEELAAEFGYTFARKRLNLPQYLGELDRINDLQNRIEEALPYVNLSTETARREILISPIILDLIHYTKAEVRIEYPIKVTEQLQGYLDYFLQKQHQLLIIEAKKGDLDFGFTQLTAQLIALDQWEAENPVNYLLGAVTTGKIWEFGLLNRQTKHIDQGLDSYRVPDDVETLMRILVHALLN